MKQPILLKGIPLAKSMEEEIKKKFLLKEISAKPGLAFIRVGEDPSSKIYIQIKKRKCEEVGIRSFDYELPASVSEEALLDLIHSLNQDSKIHGILLQLPIPVHLDPLHILAYINPNKDVDGFHPMNMGRLLLGHTGGLIPCTPKGIHNLLIAYDIPIEGKHVVIVGRSNIVGKPLGALLMQKHSFCNATVTIAHSQSEHLPKLCKEADILVAAVGKPHCITEDMVKTEAVVIDVGINKKKDGTIIGDVDFANVSKKCSHITPVPGGIGPMTIASLMANTVQCFENRSRSFS